VSLDRHQASATGKATLEAFANTPRLNAWLHSKIADGIHGEALEIGSGIGNMTELIRPAATHLVATDTEPHYLEELRARFASDPNVQVVPYDLDADPPAEVAARQYDAIVAINVIEHIADDHRLVARLAALLRPGGKLLIYVPACPFAYGTLDVALGHHRRYTPETLSALLRSASLEPTPPTYVNLLGLASWFVGGRILRRKRLAPWSVGLFERLVPLVRLEDHVRLPIGLGLWTQALKPIA
jgi:SAM-dependent methyltransferase